MSDGPTGRSGPRAWQDDLPDALERMLKRLGVEPGGEANAIATRLSECLGCRRAIRCEICSHAPASLRDGGLYKRRAVGQE